MLKLNDMKVEDWDEYGYFTTKFLFKSIQQNINTSHHTGSQFQFNFTKSLQYMILLAEKEITRNYIKPYWFESHML